MTDREPPHPADAIFDGPGEARSLARAVAWAGTPLGPVEGWPRSLRATVRLALDCPTPMALWLGSEFTLLHNDGYARLLGGKAGWAMGRPAAEVWSEVWSEVGSEFRALASRGIAARHEDAPYLIRRNGREEKAYFTFTLTPLKDDDGTVLGLVNVCEETTPAVHALARSEEKYRALVDSLRQSQARLEAERARLQAIIDTIPVGFSIADATGTVVTRNTEAARFWGEAWTQVSFDELGRYQGYWPESGERVKPEEWPAVQALRQGRRSKGVVVDVVRFDGSRGTIVISAAPILDEQGKVTGAVSATQDISELREAQRRLEEADRRKSEFLAVLSHELRNPLAPIRNSLYLLDHAPAGGPQAARAREVLGRQTAHLARLVDDLLDMTRISRGKVDLRRSRVDLAEVVARTTEDLRSTYDARAVVLRLERPPRPAWVDGDAVRLAQVLGNLLQNAVKFTPAGGTVTVTLSTDEARATVAVRDTGAGMEPDEVAGMFEPFAQGAQDMARSHGGLGLGLALVKGWVELHGGAVRAASAGPGQGSEFAFELPLAKGGAGRPAVAAAGAPASPRRDVLVIEDNADAGQTLAGILQLRRHRVRVARDARSGMALARQRTPDVILCDIGLPDLSGYRVARAVREDPALRGALLVALTGYAQPEDRRRAAEAGFDAHLSKPPPLEELEALLRDAAGSRR